MPWLRKLVMSMRGSGGTSGGVGEFTVGFVLAGLATWLFLDSVIVSTEGRGWVALGMNGMSGGQMGDTVSSGLLFLPFFLGVLSLFVDARRGWAWKLTYGGVAILVIEILSRVRFLFQTRASHLMLMLVLFAAGAGLMIRSYGEKSDSAG